VASTGADFAVSTAAEVKVGATGARLGAGRGGVANPGIGAVRKVGAAAGGVARRCGTRDPPNAWPGPAAGARGAGLAVSPPSAWVLDASVLGADATGGISPVPRGKGPAMKVVWGGRPHCA
jgi:hypothetical protein